MRIIFDPTEISRPTAIALGNFDGVHIGHRRVITPILPTALGDRRLTSTVVSFAPHPQEFFSNQLRPLLAPFDEKVSLLADLGVEQLVLLPFNADLAKLTATEFIQKILIESMQVEIISVGFDFRFGKQRQGSIADLQNIWGDRLTVISEQTMNVEHSQAVRISSSNIRAALAEGNIDLANSLLGRPYNLIGEVVYGNQLGRTIGFPTANLAIPQAKCLPRDGVYAVQVQVNDMPPYLDGIMNIGMRPTVNGTKRSLEVHLFAWQGDLYGQRLNVELGQFIRPEQKFDSLDALKSQILQDCQSAKVYNALRSNLNQ